LPRHGGFFYDLRHKTLEKLDKTYFKRYITL
jgi:hypothetical protein